MFAFNFSLKLSPGSLGKNNNQKIYRKQKNSITSLKNMQTGAQNYDGVRIGPPPDLPSLLLHNRIVYLGMPLVPAVTELIVAEFLYLQYENAQKPVFMYINSTGTSNPDGSSAGFETEAFAIADTMNYIKPPVHTICVGQALGTCAMLLSSGEKGQRAALPNSTIMIHQPRTQARGQASDIAIKAREVLYNRKQCFEIIAKTSGQSLEKVMKDASRTKYLSPQEAVEYGIIDKILESNKSELSKGPSFLQVL
jgi:ATP-dependent Clp protease protease subunit